jgi:hypothetical protein
VARLITSLVIFAAFYYPVRLLKENWVRLSLPSWCVIPAGLLSWGAVLSLAGPPIAIGYVCANIVTSLTMGAAFEAAAVFFLTGIVANVVVVHREILDWDHTGPFIRTSMMFRNYFSEEEDLFQQLEKKQIRDIHRKTTGKELVEPIAAKKEMPHTDPEATRRMLEEMRLRPIQSIHLADELSRLKTGETVDITDTFTINTFKRPTHALYKASHEMRIDATAKIMSFAIHYTQISGDTALTRDLIIRVEQDLYDALQALIDEQWLRPYKEFFEKISVTCFRVSVDSFDLPQQYPFMRVEIPVRELQLRQGKFFSVADLPSIATVTMLEKS